MRALHLLFAFALFLNQPVCSQYLYEQKTEIPVVAEDENLDLAWAGGINAGQPGNLDVNLDGTPDLVVFDRSTNKVSVFIYTAGDWVYNPHYETFFPDDLDGWVLWRDFNCDGKVDIFTNTLFGIKVYQNISEDQLSFELEADPIYTIGSSGEVNLQVNITDIPGVADIDGDGDLDILVYDFGVGGFIRYHKNLSVEKYGHCGSLEYQRVTSNWGDFEECVCGLYAFNGETCEEVEGGRLMHAGGKSMLLLDRDGDGDQDLVMSQEDCHRLYYLENQGDDSDALMLNFNENFPGSANPIESILFPAAFLVDVNNDNIKDLIASPNWGENVGWEIDFANSMWLYNNTGTNEIPDFQFIKRDFLQAQMLDFGDRAYPLLFDLDADGDQDLLVGANRPDGQEVTGMIHLLRNTGASFTIETIDYQQAGTLNLVNLQIFIQQINGNGPPELIVSGISKINGSIRTFYRQNNSWVQLNLPLEPGDQYQWADTNLDGQLDLIVGKTSGALYQYLNRGTNLIPDFRLNSENFLGFDNDFFRRELRPVIGDLNSNGREDLILTDASGAVRIVTDFRSQPEQLDSMAVFNPIVDNSVSIHTASKTQLTFGALFGNNVMVAGTRAGGLTYFQQLDANNSEKIQIKVWPNPIFAENLLHIQSSEEVDVEIIGITGSIVYRYEKLRAGEVLQLDSKLLVQGLYIVRMIDKLGQAATKKVIVIK